MKDEKDDQTHLRTRKVTAVLGWGDGRPAEDDPAEAYIEASKNVPSMQIASPVGLHLLETDPRSKATISRSVKEHVNLPRVSLPPPQYPDMALEEAIAGRKSRRDFGPDPISLQALSTLLHASYGVTHELDPPAGGQQLRTVPSGGALYPLEIYPVVRNIEGLSPGLYHYHPLRHALEVIREDETDAPLQRIMFSPPEAPDLAATCAVVFFVVGIFWRTRFKYGMRGLRWTLLEAGHIGQSMLLAAESLGVSALPWGGIWDRKVDSFLGVDGVNETVVYCLVAGSTPSGEPRSFS